mmetsp:Transcript_57995/g.131127  ORF Transcript_57995/g.131127 Transcript_57995/m.131127 type:complete len:178 (-) Transcript_57995:78-611(-)
MSSARQAAPEQPVAALGAGRRRHRGAFALTLAAALSVRALLASAAAPAALLAPAALPPVGSFQAMGTGLVAATTAPAVLAPRRRRLDVEPRGLCRRHIKTFDATEAFGQSFDVYAAVFAVSCLMFIALFATPFFLYFNNMGEDDEDDEEDDFFSEPMPAAAAQASAEEVAGGSKGLS